MRVFLILLALGCLCQAARVTDAEIAALVEKLQKVAKGESGITSDEQLVAKRLQKVGAPAIPYLLPLLESSNKGIRDLTSYTLRDIDGLTENDLDALIASCRKGDGWIPPAIAKIGNQKAVEFLVAELVRQRQAETQLTFAVSMLGAKAVPYLVDVYRTNDSWDTELDRALLSVFHDMGSKGSTAIDPLLEVAVDENVDPERRVRAINAVSAIGTSAERAVPTLQKLRLSPVPKISSAAANAIISSGSAEAVPILTGRLDAEPDELYIKLIAGLGNHGESAGPSLARYLKSDDWEIRDAAACAIGHIGCHRVADDLIKLLACADDWKAVFCAAQSLGWLKETRAIPALSRISGDHWYPPVRRAAAEAIQQIHGRRMKKLDTRDANFFVYFDLYRDAGRDLENLTVSDFQAAALSPAGAFGQSSSVSDVTITAGGRPKVLPNLTVKDGYLVPTDNGEWGGNMTFVDLDGVSHIILHENTHAIYKTPGGIVALTGAHMINYGRAYKVRKVPNGEWIAEKWLALPGAPGFSVLLPSGYILMSCSSGGIVLCAPDGQMRSLSRRQALPLLNASSAK